MNLVISDSLTMTSLEMVEFLNSQRGPGESALRHDHFMAKVRKVLGNERALKFQATYEIPGPNNSKRSAPCYLLPAREACFMAMSYSYELGGQVFDAWQAVEQKTLQLAQVEQDPEVLIENARNRAASDAYEDARNRAARDAYEDAKRAVDYEIDLYEYTLNKCTSAGFKLRFAEIDARAALVDYRKRIKDKHGDIAYKASFADDYIQAMLRKNGLPVQASFMRLK